MWSSASRKFAIRPLLEMLHGLKPNVAAFIKIVMIVTIGSCTMETMMTSLPVVKNVRNASAQREGLDHGSVVEEGMSLLGTQEMPIWEWDLQVWDLANEKKLWPK